MTSLSHSTVPLADAMARISPALRVVMLAGAALSMFGLVSSDILGSPRILFAFARDGLLPRVLGRVHPRSHAPHVAILCYAALAIGLALTWNFCGACCAFNTRHRRALYRRLRGGVAAGAQWCGSGRHAAELSAGSAAAMVVGITSMLVMIALASRAEIIGLFAVIGVSAIVYLVQARSALARR